MPNINRGRVAIQWYAERQKRADEKAAKEAASAVKAEKPEPVRKVIDIGWTDEKDTILKAMFPTHTARAVADATGMTTGQVYARAYHFNLQKRAIMSAAQREWRAAV